MTHRRCFDSLTDVFLSSDEIKLEVVLLHWNMTQAAEKVIYAFRVHIGMLAMWGESMDKGCSEGPRPMQRQLGTLISSGEVIADCRSRGLATGSSLQP